MRENRNDTFALAIELAQALSLLIAMPHTFLADAWVLPSVVPLVPLAMTVVRLVVQSRRRRRAARAEPTETRSES